MIPVDWDEILSRFVSIPAVLYILHKLYVKSFIPARRDPSFVLPGSRFAGTKYFHVIASARLSGMKNLINTSF